MSKKKLLLDVVLFVWSSCPFLKLSWSVHSVHNLWSVSPKSPQGRSGNNEVGRVDLQKVGSQDVEAAASSLSNTFLPPARSLFERCAPVCGRSVRRLLAQSSISRG
jgi:hypothetical protein